ncbi:MAG: hypothetical protein F6K30_16645 [Cyanothece sp. SIO2G6]|nr:hypothetical protein [Cyanothece sp. SIO2G6]
MEVNVVNLSPKAMRFLVDALEYRMADYEKRLAQELDEETVSDLTNDLMFMESLHQELQEALKIPIAQVF